MKTIWTSAKFLAVLLLLASVLLVAGLVWVDGQASAVLIGVAFIGLACFLFLALFWAKQAFSEVKLNQRQLDQKFEAVKNDNRKLNEAFVGLQQDLPTELSRRVNENLRVALQASLSRLSEDLVKDLDTMVGQKIDSEFRDVIENSLESTKQEWEASLGQQLRGTEAHINTYLQHVVTGELSARISESNESIELGLQRSESSVELAKNKIIASLGRIGRAQTALDKKLDSHQAAIPSQVANNIVSELDARESGIPGLDSSKSIYNIHVVPPMKVVKSNTSGALGRSAAIIEVEGNSTEQLRMLKDAASEAWQAKTAVVASESIMNAIQGSYDVVEISPNQAVVNTERVWDFVVIEESFLTIGGWAGILETFRLQTYLDLENFVLRAKKQGALVIVIDSHMHYAMTNTLRKLADVRVMANGVPVEQNGSSVNLDICQKMMDATKTEEERNV